MKHIADNKYRLRFKIDDEYSRRLRTCFWKIIAEPAVKAPANKGLNNLSEKTFKLSI